MPRRFVLMDNQASDDSYEMSGAGIFDAQGKSVTAAGTFAHKSSDGTVLETGVWITSRLISFDSYVLKNLMLRFLSGTASTSFNKT